MGIFTRLVSTTPVTASGAVSHLKDVATTTGSGNSKQTSIRTSHETWFRVDGRPAVYKGLTSLAEGDRVTIVGRDRGDAVSVVAIRNDQTGIETAPIIRTWPMWVLIAIGVPAIPVFGIGILLIGFGIAGFIGNKQNKEMIELLQRTASSSTSEK